MSLVTGFYYLRYKMSMMRLAMSEDDRPGRKDDQDKLRYDLLDVDFEEEMARVLTEGAKKYSPNSWQKVEDAKNRYYAALRRHVAAIRKGEFRNSEDGDVSHFAQIAINAMFLYVLETKMEDK